MGKDNTRDELIGDLGKLINKYLDKNIAVSEMVGALEIMKFYIIDRSVNRDEDDE